MKKLWSLLLCLLLACLCACALADVPIDEEHFPDETFRNWVYDNCHSGSRDDVLTDAEAGRVTYMYLDNKGITSLKGIEYFTSLTTLYCQNNQLEELDVSSLTNLKKLYCSRNQLVSLNVSGCSALEELDCYVNQLDSLNLGGCSSLKKLWCYENPIGTLDVSASEKLSAAAITKPSSGTTSGGTAFHNFDSKLYVSPETAVKAGDFTSEPYVCDISGENFPDGAFLSIVSGYDKNQDGKLGRTENTQNSLTFNNKSITSLEGIEYFTYVTDLHCTNNALSSLDVSKNTKLKSLYCYSNALSSLKLNEELTYLDCDTNALTELDLSRNTKLITLRCRSNALTKLDLSACSALKGLYCYSNKLSSLNLNGVPALTKLECHNNELVSLDVTACPDITELRCYSNKLTSLKVTGLAKMTYLSCNTNQFTTLDLSGCEQMIYLMANSQRTDSGSTATYKFGAFELRFDNFAEIKTDGSVVPATGTIPEQKINGGKYKLNKKKTAAIFCGPEDWSNQKTLVIQDTVEICGRTYKVTEIAKNACNNMKKLTSVTIGKYVKKIGNFAFHYCKKLKKVTIKATGLKKIGQGAFEGIRSKATFKVPKKKLKAYTKLIRNAGAPKKSRITK